MSRLSKILNVEEGQEFEYESNKLKVVNNKIFAVDTINGEESWFVLSNAEFLMSIIAFPEKIKIIPTKLTEQQITAIKGRIIEGWEYIAKDAEGTIAFYMTKPQFEPVFKNFFTTEGYAITNFPIYNFLKPCQCFCLADLIKMEGEVANKNTEAKTDEDKNNI